MISLHHANAVEPANTSIVHAFTAGDLQLVTLLTVANVPSANRHIHSKKTENILFSHKEEQDSWVKLSPALNVNCSFFLLRARGSCVFSLVSSSEDTL